MSGEPTEDRHVIAITGADREPFLQNLVSNDISNLEGRLVYAALLTPQGKYLADFFLTEAEGAILLDVKAALAPGLTQRLSLYRLRADVEIAPTDITVTRGLGEPPQAALADPRHPSLGWVSYWGESGTPGVDWDGIRVASCVPESAIELIPNETYILEAGFERLNGVDFRKGCYVGQEVTARMKHKTELKKGFAIVAIDGTAPIGTEITANGKAAGKVYTQANGQAIAYLRFDRAKGDMQAGDAQITRVPNTP